MTREEQIETVLSYLIDKLNSEIMEVYDYAKEYADYIGITMDDVQEFLPYAPDWDRLDKITEKVLEKSPWILQEVAEEEWWSHSRPSV